MKVKILAIITIITVFLCGCEASNEKDSNENKEYNIPEYTLAGELHEGNPNIYLIVKSIDNNYFKVMFDAARDASAELGCNVYYSGSESSSEWEVQAALMDIAAKENADAVILAPDDTARLADKVEELYAKGIAVICVDAVINSNSYDVCFMTDNLAAGEQAAMEMLTHMKNSGLSEDKPAQIAIQTGRSSSQTISERVAGFCQYWTKNAPKKWEIISKMKSNEGDDDKAFSIAEEFFSEYDNIKGVFGTNNGTTKGFAKYIYENNMTDVAIVGFDYSDEAAAIINDSSYRGSVILQKQYDMAYNGIKSAIEIKNGTFSTDSKLVDTGVMAVSNANINDSEVKAIIERN